MGFTKMNNNNSLLQTIERQNKAEEDIKQAKAKADYYKAKAEYLKAELKVIDLDIGDDKKNVSQTSQNLIIGKQIKLQGSLLLITILLAGIAKTFFKNNTFYYGAILAYCVYAGIMIYFYKDRIIKTFKGENYAGLYDKQ